MPQRNLKEQLVAGASQVLLERGYHAASVNDIVAAASVPKGSFYNHFDSKEDLAGEVLARYILSYPMAELADGDAPPLQRLWTFFADSIERTVERGVGCGCMLGSFSTELPGHSDALSRQVREAIDDWAGVCAQAIREAQADGSLASGLDADALGRYVVNAFEGAVAHAKVRGDREPLDTFLTVTFTSVLHA